MSCEDPRSFALHVHFLNYGVRLCHDSGVVLVVKWSVGFNCSFYLMVSLPGLAAGLGGCGLMPPCGAWWRSH